MCFPDIVYSMVYILYMYITKYGCVFLKLGESIYLAMDLILILLVRSRSPIMLMHVQEKDHVRDGVINPRRACAARVTVVVLCVCPSVRPSVRLSVCLSTTILGLQATRRLMSDTNIFSATRARKLNWRFC